jgi:hypothetical protein
MFFIDAEFYYDINMVVSLADCEGGGRQNCDLRT